MGLGILEDTKLREVPGTATLEELDGREVKVDSGRPLKRNKAGIILIPQPSDDPNDPLNWPLWQRDLITTVLCIVSVLAATLSPLMAANTLTMIVWFGGLSVTQAALLTGYHLLGVGVSGFLFVASARVWGKRHLFVSAPLLIIISCIWAGFSGKNYESLVAARFFQGVGLAPFEGLLNTAVGDMYFVHESGKRLAMANLSLFGGVFFTPVIVGIITLRIGWQWTFWLVAIFVAAVYPFIYLICAETTYPRKLEDSTLPSELPGRLETEERGSSSIIQQPTIPWDNTLSSKQAEQNQTSDSTADSSEDFQIHQPVNRRLITRESLAIFSGRKTPDPFLMVCIRPFPLFFHPAILWACLTQGVMIAWSALIGISLALILISLNFNEAETGYMYTGAFIGAMVAFVLAGFISDPAARWLSKRNKGVFEPEFRIILALPAALFGISGLFGFGHVAANVTAYGWLLPDVFFGFVVGGMTLGAIVSAQYLVDAHRDITIESFTCMLVFKNLVSYGVTYKGLDWLLTAGTQKAFFSVGYVQIAIYATAVPMYILGKKNRSFFTRYDILKILRLR